MERGLLLWLSCAVASTNMNETFPEVDKRAFYDPNSDYPTAAAEWSRRAASAPAVHDDGAEEEGG